MPVKNLCSHRELSATPASLCAQQTPETGVRVRYLDATEHLLRVNAGCHSQKGHLKLRSSSMRSLNLRYHLRFTESGDLAHPRLKRMRDGCVPEQSQERTQQAHHDT